MNRLRTYTAAVAATVLLSAVSCSKDEAGLTVIDSSQTEVASEDGARKGELLVCFTPDVAEIIEASGLTKGGEASDRSGVLSVDRVLDIAGAYSLRRVFPVDPRNEERTRMSGLHRWYVVNFDETIPVEKVAADLSVLGEVSRVEFNRTIQKAYTGKSYPLTPEVKAAAEGLFSKQWNLVNNGDLFADKSIKDADVQVSEAWKLSTGDPSVIVAVLDEGVALDHPQLKESMWVNEGEIYRSHEDNDGNGYAGDVYGYNFARGTGIISYDDVYDSGHGTHVAGVIAARNNGTGIRSIAGGDSSKPGVKIMSCQIFSGNLAGTVLSEVQAIKYAADNGAVILQCSWGYVSGAANPFEWLPNYADDDTWVAGNPLEKMALDYFIHNAGSPNGVIDGGIAIFAAGNENAAAAGYPGAYPDYVSVAATAADFTPAVYTNYGFGTSISAPGGDQDYYYEYGEGEARGAAGCILSTLPFNVADSGYGYMEGTSMACPHVSGVAALGLSYAAKLHKHFTAEQFRELLLSSVTEIDQYMTGTKKYYKYVTDLGDAQPMLINKSAYKGNMGTGQVNAYKLLKAVEGADVPDLTFPNIYVAPQANVTLIPSMYFNGTEGTYSVVFDNPEIASAEYADGKLTFTGKKEGQTRAVVSVSGASSQNITVTVRKNASSDGWL
ncbi:MAG: S8 family peptidase [Candidatus Cryptobacteroides sp.]